MNEKTLLKVSLISSILGVVVLAVFSADAKISEKPLFAYEEDGDISFYGNIEKISKRGNLTVFSVSRNEVLDVVVFEDINFSEGAVFVKGTVKDYDGKKEVIAERIEPK